MPHTSRPPPVDSLAGIDRLLADADRLRQLRRRRVALLTNAACRTADGTPGASALSRALTAVAKPGLVRIFAPEHGFASDAAAGAPVADHRDPASGSDVVSLYGARRAPAPRHLADLDTLIVDLRDVGVRCYTYAATAALAAAAALEAGVEVVICDRANPLGGAADGPPRDPRYRSFLAYFDTRFVHGQTLGDLVADALAHHPAAALLSVIAPHHNGAGSAETWVPPSPALQSPDAVALYPGLVLFEGTNLSEGRHTPLSFRAIGAPWLDTASLARAVNRWSTGVTATAVDMRPGAGDYGGHTLPAVRFDAAGPRCDGFGLGVRLLAWIADAHHEFAWRTAPMVAIDPATDGSAAATRPRYVVDSLLGSASLREALARGDSADEILAGWRDQAAKTVSPSTTT